jgi:hypothetical protein
MNTELFGVISIFILYNFSRSFRKYIAKILREIKHSLTRFSIQLKIYFQNKWYQFH